MGRAWGKARNRFRVYVRVRVMWYTFELDVGLQLGMWVELGVKLGVGSGFCAAE